MGSSPSRVLGLLQVGFCLVDFGRCAAGNMWVEGNGFRVASSVIASSSDWRRPPGWFLQSMVARFARDPWCHTLLGLRYYRAYGCCVGVVVATSLHVFHSVSAFVSPLPNPLFRFYCKGSPQRSGRGRAQGLGLRTHFPVARGDGVVILVLVGFLSECC